MPACPVPEAPEPEGVVLRRTAEEVVVRAAAVQAELARLGFYRGPVLGAWTAGAGRALAEWARSRRLRAVEAVGLGEWVLLRPSALWGILERDRGPGPQARAAAPLLGAVVGVLALAVPWALRGTTGD